MTDCVIRSRVDLLIKAKADKLFKHMGLTLSEAIRLSLTFRCRKTNSF